MLFALCTNDTILKVELCDYDFLCANATAFLNVDGTTAEFSYADLEGDLVTIKNQADVDEAIAYMKDAGLDTLRINVSLSTAASAVPAPLSAPTPPEVPSPPSVPEVPTPTPCVSSPPVIHARRVCDGCSMYPIVGTRYRSARNPGLDFCTSCVAQTKWQRHAPFEAIDKELVTHDSVTCDGCQMSPLEGVRYKSAVVDDFDLCAACEASGKWAATHEPFLKITHPRKSVRPDNVHDGVVCDGCNVHPIVGARFKSAMVKNFDLCETCERSGKWNLSHGPLLKIYTRKQTPAALYVATAEDEDVQSQEEFTAQAQQQHNQGHRPHHHHHHHGHHPHHPHPHHHHHPHHGHHHHHHHHGHHHSPHHHDKQAAAEAWKSKREFWKQHCNDQKAQWKEQCKAQKAQWKEVKKQCKRQQQQHARATFEDTTVPSLAEAVDHIKAQMTQHFTPGKVAEIQDTLKAHLPTEVFEAFKARSDEWLASATNETVHQATFVEDVTIPDGTVCFPGEALTKQWRLRNTGSEAWPVGCTVAFEGGASMAREEGDGVTVPPLAPGADCVVEMALVAPQETGRHASHFRLSANKAPFGERFWIDVVVDAEMAQVAEDNMVTNAIPLATLVVHDDDEEKPAEVVEETQVEANALEEPKEVAQEDEIKDEHVEETASETSSDDFVALTSPADEDALEAEADKLMEEQDEFATELAMLGAMGFENNERLRALLAEFEGNLEKVVEQLLQ